MFSDFALKMSLETRRCNELLFRLLKLRINYFSEYSLHPYEQTSETVNHNLGPEMILGPKTVTFLMHFSENMMRGKPFLKVCKKTVSE